MENIRGINALSAARALQQSKQTQNRNTPSAPAGQGDDTVEISFQARMAGKLASLPPVRQELVDRVRSEIEAGTYETPEKMEAALENLLSEL